MVADNAPEKVGPGTHFRRVVHYTHINLTQTETYTPKQNKAYPMIRRLRKRWCKTMSRKNNPGEAMEFWFGLEIRYHYESGLRPYWKYWVQNPEVRTPVFKFLGFDFHQLIEYWGNPQKRKDNPKLILWMGVSHRVVCSLCCWVMTKKGEVVSCTTVHYLPEVYQHKY